MHSRLRSTRVEEALPGKPVNSSEPSLSAGPDAIAEHMDESCEDDEKFTDAATDGIDVTIGSSTISYSARLDRRSTSVDVAALGSQGSPPPDPWKFFVDIKGKITKSVEEKITEIKMKHQDEELAKKVQLSMSKENSSFSNSDDFSESSVAKTYDICSPADGLEFLNISEKDSHSEKKANKFKLRKFKLIRNKQIIKEGYININSFKDIYEIATGRRCFNSDSSADGIENAIDALEENNQQLKNCNINVFNITGSKKNKLNENEVLKEIIKEKPESTYANDKIPTMAISDENKYVREDESTSNDLLFKLAQEVNNIYIDPSDNSVCINEIMGSEITFQHIPTNDTRKENIYFAPKGFTDLRTSLNHIKCNQSDRRHFFIVALVVAVFSVFMCFLSLLPSLLIGFIEGIATTLIVTFLIKTLSGNKTEITFNTLCDQTVDKLPILKMPTIKEYKPLTKFEGWMNEFPDNYNPHTYHVTETQSVHVKLQGNLLRLSYAKIKIPKRVLWNEPHFKPTFIHHRIYNLFGSRISLLPEGLNKKRYWSKKYPICITLKEDQLNDLPSNKMEKTDETCGTKKITKVVLSQDKNVEDKEYNKSLTRSKDSEEKPQIYSKLFEKYECAPNLVVCEEYSENFDTKYLEDIEYQEKESRSKNEIEKTSKEIIQNPEQTDTKETREQREHNINNHINEWTSLIPNQLDSSKTHLYLFGRTGREKEDWFRRFKLASQEQFQLNYQDSSFSELYSEVYSQNSESELEYIKYMSRYQLRHFHSNNHLGAINDHFEKFKTDNEQLEEAKEEKKYDSPLRGMLWFNVLIGRVIYDCLTNDQVFNWINNFIQKKLNSIKLPYFIEELTLKDLHLGSEPPTFKQVNDPYTDEKGLWVDLNISYDGCLTIYVYTKLNLMKLKQPPQPTNTTSKNECSAIYNSDIEDSAESSSDEEPVHLGQEQNANSDNSTQPTVVGCGSSNTSKKLMKMVDKIAESKLFQRASENKFVKKAMEGVSNTDFGIKIEIRHLCGVIAVNIPPPPSDRIWYGFRPVPEVSLSAHPIVGEKNITFIYVKNWIEKKLVLEFQKVLVIPNMDDLYLPILSPLVSN